MRLDDAKRAIGEFASFPATSLEPEMREAAMQALEALRGDCVRVQGKANGYPANPVTAEVWLDGAVLGPRSEGLASLFTQRGLTDTPVRLFSYRNERSRQHTHNYLLQAPA